MKFVRIVPTKILGLGDCVRVACSCGDVAEIPNAWWEYRVVEYGLNGAGAVEACHQALADWREAPSLN